MFGLNEEDKSVRTQPLDDNQAAASDATSPFAAAYSSLSRDHPSPVRSPAPTISVPKEDLLQIKTQALASLAPLVDHLDQPPEEKFKTTMMMIQASYNPELIHDAYHAASQIEDEKARAQALLDVINEINYFTQRGKD